MTQSVELTFDARTDAAIRVEWARLAAAGLPTEQRRTPSPSHRPHLTLYAGDRLDASADATLPRLMAGLEVPLRIGALLLFGPRHGSYIVVRQVVVSRELLELQAAVAALCGAEPEGHFGPGRWTPHVTLARRVGTFQVEAVLTALGAVAELDTVSRYCRRWDSDRRETWLLTGDADDG